MKPTGGVGILARVEQASVRYLNALRVEGSVHTINPTRVEGAKGEASGCQASDRGTAGEANWGRGQKSPSLVEGVRERKSERVGGEASVRQA